MFPWYSTAMLALEANHVIALRLSKLAFGGLEARSEAKLMITEKIDAAVEGGRGSRLQFAQERGRLGGCCSLS